VQTRIWLSSASVPLAIPLVQLFMTAERRNFRTQYNSRTQNTSSQPLRANFDAFELLHPTIPVENQTAIGSGSIVNIPENLKSKEEENSQHTKKKKN
jgi:hypothetical protein